MSAALPVSRPVRPNSPDLRLVVADESDSLRERHGQEESSRMSIISPRPQLSIADVSNVEPDLSVTTPPTLAVESSSESPRGLVILEQVLGRRDSIGRPITFARKLRHRLFGFALGLTLVSAASLMIGLVGGIDQVGSPDLEDIEPLGTSAVAITTEEMISTPYRNSETALVGHGGQDEPNARRVKTAEFEEVDESASPVWFEGGIVDDDAESESTTGANSR